MEYHNTLEETREALVEAQILLRSFDEKSAKAQAEDRAIKAVTTKDSKGKPDYGSNPEDRARYLIVAIAEDFAYGAYLTEMRSVQADIDRLQAEVDFFHDERRRYEWGIRDRIAHALEKLGVQSDSGDPSGDDVFNDALDHAVDQVATGILQTTLTDEDDIPF